LAREQRRLAAIVAADVVGYSRLMGRDESGTLAALKAVRRDIVDPILSEHGGRLVKTTGDGLLVEFASVVDAVRCTMELQTAMARRNSGEPEERRIVFRVGINEGDIIIEGGDIFGDGVNVAARLQEIAPPGGICLSSRVQDEVRNRVSGPFEDVGQRPLKNIARPVRVYCWMPGSTESASAAKPIKMPAGRHWIAGVGAASLLALGIGSWWFSSLPGSLEAPTKTTTTVAGAAPFSSSRPGIAVLPFINLSGDATQDYFSDGLTEDVIAALGRFGSLTVMARNAVFPFKGKNIKPAEIGRELGVQYIVEGSVRRAGPRVRISVQLTDAVAGRLLWSQQYDQELKDVFAVQDEVTRQVAGALAINLTQVEQRRALSKPPESLGAYDLVLRGRERLLHFTRSTNREARQLLEQAVALDPKYADAYAWNARAHMDVAEAGWTEDPNAAAERALELGRRAVMLDPDSVLGHRVIGLVHLARGEFDRAYAEIDRALTLNPSDSVGLMAQAEILLWLGRLDESIEASETAFRFDPLPPVTPLFNLGLAYYERQRHADALRLMTRASERFPDNPFVHALLAAIYARLDRPQDAARERDAVGHLHPFFQPAAFGSRFQDPAYHAYLFEGLVKAGFK
jgi:TolB-like protein/class 3 adenylate cyclase/Tfp pilus assembly protein PilF